MRGVRCLISLSRKREREETHLRILAACFARVLQIRFRPQTKRAQGMPSACCTRGLVCKVHSRMRTRAYRYSRSSPAFPAQWFYGLCRALVSAISARMCERAVLTNRPSLDLIPFVLKGREPVGERGTDPVVFLNPNSCTGFEPEPSKEGSG